MKRNKFYQYAILLALPWLGSNLMTSCTDSFEDLNTNSVQVDPNDLPFSAQCTEPMQYCYPPQQNMFQFWTNLTIDLYSGYFMTPNGNFTNGDMGETADTVEVCTKTITCIYSTIHDGSLPIVTKRVHWDFPA